MKIEYYWNDDEIQFEIDIISSKGEIKRKYFQPTKMWAEAYIEKIKRIAVESNREITSVSYKEVA